MVFMEAVQVYTTRFISFCNHAECTDQTHSLREIADGDCFVLREIGRRSFLLLE